MTTIELHGEKIERANTVLRDAVFHSPSTRLTSQTDYHKVEVGMREGEFTTWLGSWDQSSQKAEGGVGVGILPQARLGMRIAKDRILVVRVTQTGAPATLLGSRVDLALGLVGGHGGAVSPLVSTGSALSDLATQARLGALERQVNTGGLSEWTVPVQLLDPTADDADVETQQSYSTGDVAITAAAGLTSTAVTITFTKPAWAATGYVDVTGVASLIGAGAGAGALAIYDGTTAHNTLGFTISTAAVLASTGYNGTITATTTYILQALSTGSNMTVDTSLIRGTCHWRR